MKLAWSELARRDLRRLRRYSIAGWGREVAIEYMSDLRDAAKALAADPQRARVHPSGFRIFRVRSHFLGCAVDEATNTLTVVRVLHVAMDIDRHLR